MIDEIPTNLRVASPDQIDAVLSSFQTALAIKYASVPPSVLPMTEGSYYFQLQPSGPFWDAIVASQGLAVFIPSDLKGIVIEAVAV
jgi:type VI secretion system protein ImpJ